MTATRRKEAAQRGDPQPRAGQSLALPESNSGSQISKRGHPGATKIFFLIFAVALPAPYRTAPPGRRSGPHRYRCRSSSIGLDWRTALEKKKKRKEKKRSPLDVNAHFQPDTRTRKEKKRKHTYIHIHTRPRKNHCPSWLSPSAI
ncbi:hypothetical protein CGCVW01_v005539 [Colletotrichum viniferum]|nr:hypothetical protein CGCVW01_v005539 [Colletotrichum viniferum]